MTKTTKTNIGYTYTHTWVSAHTETYALFCHRCLRGAIIVNQKTHWV